uniref:glycosyltransferase family 4 protein n=1 Tax=Algoriphagus sp. TaxID=1872435 RepID=UPI002585EC8F|nr:glycosyltransferase [Algoriphagus sp.]
MNFLIVGHVIHKFSKGKYYAYGPYVREMNLWLDYVSEVTLLVPFSPTSLPDPIDLPYLHPYIRLVEIPEFSVTSPKAAWQTFLNLPLLFGTTWKEMRKADHIHLRCPGNMGLIGAMVQILFPNKIKSAKYAGNWDKKSSQPFTYRLQQSILGNKFLSKNMQVLVYGDWPGESSNIRSFFTASYSQREISPLVEKYPNLQEEIRLIFAGGLNEGKQPLVSTQVAHALTAKGYHVKLDLYGEGPERSKIEEYIHSNKLSDIVSLKGNVGAEQLKLAYEKSHFLIFLSQSEGWPKVVAESMFWGCVPITTAVSCVPQMLGEGERGNLVNPDINEIQEVIEDFLLNPSTYLNKSQKASQWSRQFTLEKFKEEIKSVLFDRI